MRGVLRPVRRHRDPGRRDWRRPGARIGGIVAPVLVILLGVPHAAGSAAPSTAGAGSVYTPPFVAGYDHSQRSISDSGCGLSRLVHPPHWSASTGRAVGAVAAAERLCANGTAGSVSTALWAMGFIPVNTTGLTSADFVVNLSVQHVSRWAFNSGSCVQTLPGQTGGCTIELYVTSAAKIAIVDTQSGDPGTTARFWGVASLALDEGNGRCAFGPGNCTWTSTSTSGTTYVNATPSLAADHVPLRSGHHYAVFFQFYLALVGDVSEFGGAVLGGAQVTDISTLNDAVLSVAIA